MKFLCVPCDRPMQLSETRGDRGSIALTYACPDCGYEMAMLTNPLETQVVGSLGVKIGAAGGPAPAAGESRCPFTGVARELAGAAADAPRTFPWSPEAEARIGALPEFVAPLVRDGIERFARERGYERVDERVLDEARAVLGL